MLLSGGMDSTTLLYVLRDKGYTLSALSVHYGQRHKKELNFAMATTAKLGVDHHLVDASALTPMLKGSSLTDNIEVPEGHYAADNMAATVVPNRNAILLSLAYALAITKQAEVVATAVHAGDHAIYPDCRPEFIAAFQAMENRAIDKAIYGMEAPALQTPFVHLTKAAIVQWGDELKVPWADTWSCYKGGEVHCGRCGTCVERIEAFKLARVEDPTPYSDKVFAKQVLSQERSVK